eukprot:tig00001373_g8441.t1
MPLHPCNCDDGILFLDLGGPVPVLDPLQFAPPGPINLSFRMSPEATEAGPGSPRVSWPPLAPASLAGQVAPQSSIAPLAPSALSISPLGPVPSPSLLPPLRSSFAASPSGFPRLQIEDPGVSFWPLAFRAAFSDASPSAAAAAHFPASRGSGRAPTPPLPPPPPALSLPPSAVVKGEPGSPSGGCKRPLGSPTSLPVVEAYACDTWGPGSAAKRTRWLDPSPRPRPGPGSAPAAGAAPAGARGAPPRPAGEARPAPLTPARGRHFHQSSAEAAAALRISTTRLKRAARAAGVPRWPFRKLAALDRWAVIVRAVALLLRGGWSPPMAMAGFDEGELLSTIAESRRRMLREPQHNITPLIKRLGKMVIERSARRVGLSNVEWSRKVLGEAAEAAEAAGEAALRAAILQALACDDLSDADPDPE